MANFNRDNRSGGNRSFGKPRFQNDRPDMHKATCANCGKICEVPFRPTGSKPVFCKDCFKNTENYESRGPENRSFSRSNQEDRPMYDAVCANCGNSCQIPFRPTQGRDVFCSRCFENKEGSEEKRSERRNFDKPSFNHDENRSRNNETANYKAQFEALNAKMDKILKLLNTETVETVPLESAIDEKVIEEIAEEVKVEKTEKKPKKEKKSSKSTKAKKATTSKEE